MCICYSSLSLNSAQLHYTFFNDTPFAKFINPTSLLSLCACVCVRAHLLKNVWTILATLFRTQYTWNIILGHNAHPWEICGRRWRDYASWWHVFDVIKVDENIFKFTFRVDLLATIWFIWHLRNIKEFEFSLKVVFCSNANHLLKYITILLNIF